MAISVNAKLKKFAKNNDHRIVSFVAEPPLGLTIQFEGCVTKEHQSLMRRLKYQRSEK